MKAAIPDNIVTSFAYLMPGVKFTKYTPYDLMHDVANFFNVSVQDVKSKSRERMYLVPRQVGMYMMKNLFGKTYNLSVIGSFFGGYDHATVLHAMKTVSNHMETDIVFRNQVKDMEKIVMAKISKIQNEQKSL